MTEAVLTSPTQPEKYMGEDAPIGFNDTPPWDTENSTTNTAESVALAPYKKGLAAWSEWLDRMHYIRDNRRKLWLPGASGGRKDETA